MSLVGLRELFLHKEVQQKAFSICISANLCVYNTNTCEVVDIMRRKPSKGAYDGSEEKVMILS